MSDFIEGRFKGEPINVPRYQRLKTLQQDAANCAREVRELEDTIGRIDRERQIGDVRNTSAVDLANWSNERSKLQAQYDQAYARHLNAQDRRRNADQQFAEWTELFASWIYQRRALVRELAIARDGDTYALVISDRPVRTKREVEDDLLSIAQRIANFSGDAEAVREYQELAKKIADDRQARAQSGGVAA